MLVGLVVHGELRAVVLRVPMEHTTCGVSNKNTINKLLYFYFYVDELRRRVRRVANEQRTLHRVV